MALTATLTISINGTYETIQSTTIIANAEATTANVPVAITRTTSYTDGSGPNQGEFLVSKRFYATTADIYLGSVSLVDDYGRSLNPATVKTIIIKNGNDSPAYIQIAMQTAGAVAPMGVDDLVYLEPGGLFVYDTPVTGLSDTNILRIRQNGIGTGYFFVTLVGHTGAF